MSGKAVALDKGSMAIIANTFEYDGVWYPPFVRPHILDRIRTFEVREDDLILSTFSKCGTNWMREIILLVYQDGHVDKVNRDVDPSLCGMLELGHPPDFNKSVADYVAALPSPRFYYTHLPAQHLPAQVWTKKPKMVYVTRNPKDALTSLYRFLNANPANTCEVPWRMLFEIFISKKIPFGNWFDQALAYWEHRDDGHVCFVTYEEMKQTYMQDIRSVIKRLATFLGVTVSSDGLQRIVEHSSLEGMKMTYAKIEEEVENGKMYTRSQGQIPYLQQGKERIKH
ncbi:Sulfotransferase family cytosolic 1B member 1 [Holothuria leucospilota]|uniref:Sulfotransferase family cytosolic 1B member 1 n=1 Tax=Holothuria leucospilota TaxID=206669 RepID=A0A9Q1C8H4_HOLLE|nr:Sulfotransferase family cytosolic 1B member 1 [Holothuria leucospilota]